MMREFIGSPAWRPEFPARLSPKSLSPPPAHSLSFLRRRRQMSQRAEWQRVLDTETRRWSKMSCEQLIAELGDVRAYEVEFESKLYQVEVQLLENTCAYVHVFVAVDAKTDVGHPRRRCGSLYDHPVPGHQPSNQLGRSRRNALAESADSFLQLERRCDSHSRHDPYLRVDQS
jgi:hypothetical protein